MEPAAPPRSDIRADAMPAPSRSLSAGHTAASIGQRDQDPERPITPNYMALLLPPTHGSVSTNCTAMASYLNG